jgi:hypothetical protein
MWSKTSDKVEWCALVAWPPSIPVALTMQRAAFDSLQGHLASTSSIRTMCSTRRGLSAAVYHHDTMREQNVRVCARHWPQFVACRNNAILAQ